MYGVICSIVPRGDIRSCLAELDAGECFSEGESGVGLALAQHSTRLQE